MKTKENYIINGQPVSVSSKLIQEGKTQDFNNRLKCNVFRVSVKTDLGKTSFTYGSSHNDWQNGKIELDDHVFPLYCFLSDALSGDLPWEEFCKDLGFNEDSRKDFKVWKECKKSLAKAQSVFSDVYEAINDLQEQFPDKI